MESSGRNRLGEETSPYLLQHKDNPVHWWPWSEEAFAESRKLNKPILLSVGYSACHWCHVMAHESFEDAEVAALMNELFINVKVDREERPDVDTIYQKALALTGQHGGWPLTMFLNPDGRPFWGGTYFPKGAAYGRPEFAEVLSQISRIWLEKADDVAEQSEALHRAIGDHTAERLKDGLSMSLLDDAAGRLLDYLDPIAGGMNGAPKFPMPFAFEFLWRAYMRTKDEKFRNAVIVTLTQICQGGIYDHLGGGFARYSTDREWLAPHFEKMLYDNAQLINLLTLVWQHEKSALFEERIAETIDWLQREMIGENGAFTAAFDADSEGEEGKFYVWDAGEIDRILAVDADFFKAVYDVTEDGNWEEKTILNRSAHAYDTLTEHDLIRLRECRKKLFDARAKRTPPGRDNKILADWNGLTVAALANAAMAFQRDDWLDLAQTVFNAINETMTWTDEDGRKRLGHSFCQGRLQKTAMIDDYANMANAAIALFSATGQRVYIANAENWVSIANDFYWDSEDGGYFFTSSDAEDLIVRTKSANDNAVPSGNGCMVFALARLFYLTGRMDYRARAINALQALEVDAVKSFPHGATLLNAFELLEQAVQVVVVGQRSKSDTQFLINEVSKTSIPNLVFETVDQSDHLPDVHPAKGKKAPNGNATVYVCHGPTCSPPQTTLDGLRQTLTD